VDVAQDVITTIVDCGADEGIWIKKSDDVAGQSLGSRIFGRVTAQRVVDPATGEILVDRNEMLTQELVRNITHTDVEEVLVRSPLTCRDLHGVCILCFGMDLGRGILVEKGAAIGIVAAQSIGEPGTQLTLRTFHTGGVAEGGDITTGLPRVEELFEGRKAPKGEAVVTEIAGKTEIVQSDRYSDLRAVQVVHSEMVEDEYDLVKGWKVEVDDGTEVDAKQVIASHNGTEIIAETAGRARIEKNKVIVAYEQREEAEYEIPSSSRLIVQSGDDVEPGQPLTEGSLNPHEILRIQGREACQVYLLNEVQKVYRSQGQNIHDKHFELIIRKMLSRVQVTNPGDTEYLPNDFANRLELREINEQNLADGKQPARFTELLLGITKASLSTESFLSAASFQHTIKVLAGAAIAGSEDPLNGLKENVILGKLIPAGTGIDDKEEKTLIGEEEEIPVLEAVVGELEKAGAEIGATPEPAPAD
jgi:DNA-directed RNA polymerase subunit beta'